MSTRWKIFAVLFSLCVLHLGARAETDNPDGYRFSGPVSHGNLAIYFVHGSSRGGVVPLTLQEAMAKKVVEVREIGRVNEVQIENVGDEEVFIQAGDIMKGGQQDRVLSSSLMLPPRSGAVSVASYCVESGRWSARSGEDSHIFSSSNAILPSRRAKLEMAGPAPARPDGSSGSRQRGIWNSVAQIQGKLSSNLGAPVAAPQSQTSLQLSLENGRLEREQAQYVAAIEPQGEHDNDIVGYVFAVNGKVNGADVYPSNGLFRKMWPKLLRASITEAISERDLGNAPALPAAAIKEFISRAAGAQTVETHAGERTRILVNDSAKVISLESRPAAAPASAWLHRSYIAK
ncbi:MAG: hypothetical protein E6G96_14590 [Alphaproteobacteria bacterium]|nr:MAG: hypothetical protein E6G96_14590 [Alphaproteobacteria bacterium]